MQNKIYLTTPDKVGEQVVVVRRSQFFLIYTKLHFQFQGVSEFARQVLEAMCSQYQFDSAMTANDLVQLTVHAMYAKYGDNVEAAWNDLGGNYADEGDSKYMVIRIALHQPAEQQITLRPALGEFHPSANSALCCCA
jgi:hypothetical protein